MIQILKTNFNSQWDFTLTWIKGTGLAGQDKLRLKVKGKCNTVGKYMKNG